LPVEAFRRHQAEKGHQLSRRIEPAHVADFRGKDRGDQERGTAHCLIGRNHRRHRPTRHDDRKLLFQAMQSLRCILDCVDAFLEDDLLRRMLECLSGEPTPMRQRPMAAPAIDPAATQQERKQLLAFATQIVRCRLVRSHKVANRLGNPQRLRYAVPWPAPVCEARLGTPEQPSFSSARRRGPPNSHREHDV
jgi:hypothetical protein